jgi:hypothetical protein
MKTMSEFSATVKVTDALPAPGVVFDPEKALKLSHEPETATPLMTWFPTDKVSPFWLLLPYASSAAT